jgi:hypothetical protein
MRTGGHDFHIMRSFLHSYKWHVHTPPFYSVGLTTCALRLTKTAKQILQGCSSIMYKGHLKSSWTDGSVPLLCRERR